jgi:hypothetical protein
MTEHPVHIEEFGIATGRQDALAVFDRSLSPDDVDALCRRKLAAYESARESERFREAYRWGWFDTWARML